MENLSPDLFTKSVQGREALHRLFYSLEYDIVLDGWGTIALPWVLQNPNSRYTIFYASCLIVDITLLVPYVSTSANENASL